MEKITETRTRIYNGVNGWTGETLTTVKGQTFKITTLKGRAGKISAYAKPVQASGEGGTRVISFNLFADPSIDLLTREGKATEKAVKDVHFEALAIFDAKVEAGEIQPEEQGTPQKFDILFRVSNDTYKGGHGNKWVIYDIEETNFGTNYKCVEIDTLTLGVKDHVRPISKRFGIGIYFEPGYRFQGTENDLNNLILDSIQAEKVREQEAEAAKVAEVLRSEEARTALLKEYSHLTEISDYYDQMQVKKNVLADLKHNFPGVKFSMRKRGYDSFTITWTDGPSYASVDSVVRKYNSHSFDNTGDYYDHTPDDFNNVFGGIKFLSITRELSEEVKAWREPYMALFNFSEPPYDFDQYFYRFMRHQSIPKGAKIIGFSAPDYDKLDLEEYYSFVFKGDEPEAVEVEASAAIQIVDYSEKAIAVIGETKPLKDLLKSLGGKFNFRLKCGAGWIFSKVREAEVRAALGIA